MNPSRSGSHKDFVELALRNQWPRFPFSALPKIYLLQKFILSMLMRLIKSSALLSIQQTVQKLNNVDWTHRVLLDSATKRNELNSKGQPLNHWTKPWIYLRRIELDFFELGDEGQEERVESQGHEPLADGAADVKGPTRVTRVPLGRIFAWKVKFNLSFKMKQNTY